MRKKIVLFANHNNGYAIANYLLKRNDAEIVKIIVLDDQKNQWWKSVKKLALEKKLDYIVFKSNNQIFKKLKSLSVDYIISANWRYKLSAKILNIPKVGSVNFHNSLLPKYRGAYANAWAIQNGEKISGVTLHWMTEQFDDGKIIAQKRVPVYPWDTAKELWERLNDAFLDLFKESWPHADTWKGKSKTQTGKPSYYSVADYNKSNEISMHKKETAGRFINLLRAKTFLPYYKNAYFIDPSTKKRVYITVQLYPSDETA